MINREIYMEQKRTPITIDVVKNTNAIPLKFVSMDYTIPSGANAKIYIKKPSGETAYSDCTINGNVITVKPKTQLYSEKGLSSGQIEIISGNTIAATFKFFIEVHDNLANEVASEAEDGIIGSRWSDKKWVCLGDSLTEANSRTEKHYFDYVRQKTGITVVNLGVSGTGYKKKEEEAKAFYQRISGVPECDVITIFGSGNDVNLIESLGVASDSATDTICGCINKTLDNLYALYPLTNVGIVTPTPWMGYPTTTADNNMAKYADAIISVCERRGIPYLDLYRCSSLRPWQSDYRTLAYSKDDGNGVHPDETGHAIIAPRFMDFLNALLL